MDYYASDEIQKKLHNRFTFKQFFMSQNKTTSFSSLSSPDLNKYPKFLRMPNKIKVITINERPEPMIITLASDNEEKIIKTIDKSKLSLRPISMRRKTMMFKKALKTGDYSKMERFYEDILFDYTIKVGPEHQADLKNLERKFRIFKNVDIVKDLKMERFDENYNPKPSIICLNSMSSDGNRKNNVIQNNQDDSYNKNFLRSYNNIEYQGFMEHRLESFEIQIPIEKKRWFGLKDGNEGGGQFGILINKDNSCFFEEKTNFYGKLNLYIFY